MSPIRSYRIVLPPPWVRVPLGAGARDRVHEIVEQAATQAPKEMSPDQLGPFKRELERRILTQLAAAADHGGLDHYFPFGPMHGIHLGASFFVAAVTPPGGSADVAPDELAGGVLTELVATTPGATAVDVAGTVWVRTEDVAAPDPGRAQGLDVPTRRVSYLTAVPDDPQQWILVSFSTIGDGDPDSEHTLLTVELFDAIMGTWRWATGPDGWD
ncbi:hypothetical protein DQ237_05935 [Blastococcus sp. TF02-8]|uniref:hypothetical protein n=1 Tax=Blastococcus sp. TF02-8 TaxID=2250574 RepID=UPI000DE8F3E9|nr:hypothetical protein [Blastococcus sp. TF02-8]RBY97117.1 hypothetical protein DQ237_05935 [Blastococcus sp. TF02-8]